MVEITPQDITNFDDLSDQANKLKDAATLLADELNAVDYDNFTADCGRLSDYKIEIQNFFSNTNKPNYYEKHHNRITNATNINCISATIHNEFSYSIMSVFPNLLSWPMFDRLL